VITQDKNHIPWNKNHIPSPRKPRGFSRHSYHSLTGKRQRHSERITCRRPLQWSQPKSWDNVPLDLKYVCQQYFTCMCFHVGSGNMKIYSPLSIIFPSGVALRENVTLGWIHFPISLTSMQYMYKVNTSLHSDTLPWFRANWLLFQCTP
jgi:hypothetical protein